MDAGNEAGGSAAPVHGSSAQKQFVCRIFRGTGSCPYGEQCRFSHQTERHFRPTAGLKFAVSDTDAQAMQRLRDREIAALKRLFPHRNELADRAFEVSVKATDPDWPFCVNSVLLHVQFVDDYPLSALNVFVPGTCPLPTALRNLVNKSIRNWLTDRARDNRSHDVLELSLRPFLNWFQRNIKDMFIRGLQQERLIRNAEACGITCVFPGSLNNVGSESPIADGDSQSAGESAVIDQEVGIPSDFAEIVVKVGNLSAADELQTVAEQPFASGATGDSVLSRERPVTTQDLSSASGVSEKQKCVRPSSSTYSNVARKQTTLTAEQLEVQFSALDTSESFGTMKAKKLYLVFMCLRCKKKLERELSDGEEYSATCGKCNAFIGARFSACCIHRNSFSLGYLSTSGLAVFDLVLPNSAFTVSCLECDKEQTVTGFCTNQVKSHWCSQCHVKINLHLANLKFRNSKTSASIKPRSVEEPKSKRRTDRVTIKEAGKPLPDFGTCAHYRKSFRWFRFPCCKKVYPCDLCHDQNEDHEMKYANRIVCGFCSREQTYGTGKSCAMCGKSFTKDSSGHWEGGRGCRDRVLMSTKDKQKFAGVGKTVSRRAQHSSKQCF